MPCPAKELGKTAPFASVSGGLFFCVAVISSDPNTRKQMPGGRRAIAFGACGHGMPCPYCTKCSRATIGCEHGRKFECSAPAHNSLSELRLFASSVLFRHCLCEGEGVRFRRSRWREDAVERSRQNR